MHWLRLVITVVGLGFSCLCQAQTQYTNPACEFITTFPNVALTKEDDVTIRTEFEAIPYLSAKCFRCPQACRFRKDLENQLLSGLLQQFELKDYVLTPEQAPNNGFSISGITTKENSVTRIEARVLFSENSILALATVQPEAADKSVAREFLQSPKRRTNAP
jgi:hypothetical protein